MAKAIGERFIAERARSLATVYLTRRSDLVVSAADKDEGLDLIAHMVKGEGAAERKFGVVIRGMMAPVSLDQANRTLGPALQSLQRGDGFPFPVCLLLFAMEGDEGCYTWVAEPSVGDDGAPLLELHSQANCQPLDTAAVNAIVDRVDQWYDRFYARVMKRLKGSRMGGNGLAVLYSIIDGEAGYVSEHGEPPRVLKLPVLLAYNLAKLGREHLGDLSGKILILQRPGR
jgi:hypothetical protein